MPAAEGRPLSSIRPAAPRGSATDGRTPACLRRYEKRTPRGRPSSAWTCAAGRDGPGCRSLRPRAAGRGELRVLPPRGAGRLSCRIAALAGTAAAAPPAAVRHGPVKLAAHVGQRAQNDKNDKQCFHTDPSSCPRRTSELKKNVKVYSFSSVIAPPSGCRSRCSRAAQAAQTPYRLCTCPRSRKSYLRASSCWIFSMRGS